MEQQTTLIVYGKGGVGKSTLSTHLSVCFARRGQRVLLVGCDPKTDTSTRLLGGRRPPTLVAALTRPGGHSSFADLVVSTGVGVDVLETGGPEPGTGCGGRGVAALCQFLETHRREVSAYDTVVFDVLGDLVCGGFIAPLRFALGDNVFIVSSEEAASLFAANNIARVLCQPYYDHVSLGGIIFNLRANATPRALLHEFAAALGIEVLGVVERDPLILDAEEDGATVITYAPEAAATRRFFELAAAVEQRCHEPRAQRVTPLDNDAFWALVRSQRRRLPRTV